MDNPASAPSFQAGNAAIPPGSLIRRLAALILVVVHTTRWVVPIHPYCEEPRK